nr:hypothetical protein B0A51_01504 [Rachicladosporium sp. CCFEE 5018]
MGIPMWTDPDEARPASSSSSSNRTPGLLGRYSNADFRALRDSMEVERARRIRDRRDAATHAIRQMLREHDSVAPEVAAGTLATIAALPRLQDNAAQATIAAPTVVPTNAQPTSGNQAGDVSEALVNAAAVSLLRLAYGDASATITAPSVNTSTTEQASGNTNVNTSLSSLTRPTGPLAPPPSGTSASADAPIALRYIRDKDGISIRGPAFTPNRLARALIRDIMTNVEKLPPWSVRLRFDVMLMAWRMGRGLPWGNPAVDTEAGEYWARLERHLFLHGGRAEGFVPEEAAGG